MIAPEAPARGPEPVVADDTPARRPGDSITDFGAVAFLFTLFLLALGLMYLIGTGRG